MPNCDSCNSEVKESYNFCPICNTELPRKVQPSNDNNLASDSVIMGDQFSGTKADTIIINQYASNQPSEPQENLKPVSPHPSNNNCSRCKKDFSSEQLLNCIDLECENSMCYSCYQLWQVPSITEWQFCQNHTEKMKVEHEANCKKCSSCDIPLTSYLVKSFDSCEYDGCNNSMCMDCYNRWYVDDPLVQYRSDTSNWNYCESHTNLCIEKAEHELQHRFSLLKQYCEENWEQWVRESRDWYLRAHSRSGLWPWESDRPWKPTKSVALKRVNSIRIPHKKFNFGIGNDYATTGIHVLWKPNGCPGGSKQARWEDESWDVDAITRWNIVDWNPIKNEMTIRSKKKRCWRSWEDCDHLSRKCWLKDGEEQEYWAEESQTIWKGTFYEFDDEEIQK